MTPHLAGKIFSPPEYGDKHLHQAVILSQCEPDHLQWNQQKGRIISIYYLKILQKFLFKLICILNTYRNKDGKASEDWWFKKSEQKTIEKFSLKRTKVYSIRWQLPLLSLGFFSLKLSNHISSSPVQHCITGFKKTGTYSSFMIPSQLVDVAELVHSCAASFSIYL